MCGNLFQMSQREGFGFHFIIVYGGRAMGIDKADVLEGCSCLLHGLADSEKSPSPVREGPEIWLASLLMAPPERMMLFGVFPYLVIRLRKPLPSSVRHGCCHTDGMDGS